MASEAIDAAPAAPAFGISFQVDLGGGMGIVFQTHLEREAAMNGKLDGVLDRMYAAGTRQKAKGEIEALEKHIEGQRKQIEAGDERVRQAEENYQRQKADREGIILEQQKQKEAAQTAAQQEFADSGRRGQFQPPARLRSQLSQHDAAIEKARADLDKLTNERDKALAAEQHAKGVALDEIARTETEIERRQKLIGAAG